MLLPETMQNEMKEYAKLQTSMKIEKKKMKLKNDNDNIE
jgi:hypothetical protein